MAKAAPFLITLAILLVLAMAVTTALKGTGIYVYVPYINVGIALIVVLSVYPKLSNLMAKYDRVPKRRIKRY
ncbi:MAG: hypothetical protein ACXVO1_06445 [Tumebacillaceae bacterium]